MTEKFSDINTNYDALEISLSQTLGLKTFLVRNWSGSENFETANAKLHFARTQEAWNAASAEYISAKEAMLASLRDNIAERDPVLASDLSDNDLISLQKKGHVTFRKSNTEHESAVLIFDPVPTPATSIAVLGFSDGKDRDTSTINLTMGGTADAPQPPQDEALRWALQTHFTNLWRDNSEDNDRYVPVANLVENFDLDPDDIRRYQALVNIRYALRHQNEAVNQPSRDLPSFVNFAGLVDDGAKGIYKSYYDKSITEVFSEVAAIDKRYGAIESYGFKDPQFFEKIKLAGAVMNLVYDNLTPSNTFARLKKRYDVSDQIVHDTMEDMRRRLEAKSKETFPRAAYSGVADDWRVLFPMFREVYEADKSNGPQREYLDTIMQGLQKYFPTITNAPVPASYSENEPPRELPKKTAAPGRQDPTPSKNI